MGTVEAKSINVVIPMSDWSFFVDLAELRGWKTSITSKESGIDKGLDDLKNGRVYHAKDSDDLLEQILG